MLWPFCFGADCESLDGSKSWLQADLACQELLTLRWSVHAGYVPVESPARGRRDAQLRRSV